MPEHIHQYLGAYMDGELHGTALQRVQAHLAQCQQCQSALDEMMGLSALLRDTPPQVAFTPSARFAANLNLNLPRQPQAEPTLVPLNWFIPLGILVTWLFLQITFGISDVLVFFSSLGLLGDGWTVTGSAPQTTWFTLFNWLIGDKIPLQGYLFVENLNTAQVFIQFLVSPALWQVLLTLAYVAWLPLWWKQQNRAALPVA